MHGIEAQDTMMYAADHGTPWHGLGTPVDGALTIREAFIKSGLDWDVDVRVPYYEDPDDEGAFYPADDFRLIVRRDTQQVLGMTGTEYVPLQNWEQFEFLDGLLQDGRIKINTAGSLFNSKRTWVLAQLEEDMRIGDDDYFKFVVFANGHDGKYGVHVTPTNIRVVCNNTLTAAVGIEGHLARFSIKHSRRMHSRLQEASKALQVTTEEHRRMQRFLERALMHEVGLEAINTLTSNLFGDRDERSAYEDRQAERFYEIYEEEVDRQGRNGYSLTQTVTGFADIVLRYNNQPKFGVTAAERRFAGIIDGKSAEFKRRGIEILADMGVK